MARDLSVGQAVPDMDNQPTAPVRHSLTYGEKRPRLHRCRFWCTMFLFSSLIDYSNESKERLALIGFIRRLYVLRALLGCLLAMAPFADVAGWSPPRVGAIGGRNQTQQCREPRSRLIFRLITALADEEIRHGMPLLCVMLNHSLEGQ